MWGEEATIKVLAELNGCSFADMYNRLAELGCVPKDETLNPSERRCDKWSKAEGEEAIRMREKGMTCEQIARTLGRSTMAVRAQLLKLGVRVRKPRNKDERENAV